MHRFFTTLMEKTVGEIGLINSDLFSGQFQFFLLCTSCRVVAGTKIKITEKDVTPCGMFTVDWDSCD
jgi:hypothetical protein